MSAVLVYCKWTLNQDDDDDDDDDSVAFEFIFSSRSRVKLQYSNTAIHVRGSTN